MGKTISYGAPYGIVAITVSCLTLLAGTANAKGAPSLTIERFIGTVDIRTGDYDTITVTDADGAPFEHSGNNISIDGDQAFKNVNFLVKDAVLITGLIDYFAKEQNTPPEGLRTMIVEMIELQAGPLTGTPFIEDLLTALSSFLKNPKRLSVDFNPKTPVPFTQVLGIASAAPDQLPALLGANVSAN